MNAIEFQNALAKTEGGPSTLLWPDGGRALGPWQVHPDALWTWCTRLSMAPLLSETWDAFIGRLVGAIYDRFGPSVPPVYLAMQWHLGHVCVTSDADWDVAYAARFEAACSAI